MNTSAKSSLLRHIGLFSLIFAPLCTVVGQFFWHHGVLGITAGIWQVYSYFFWIFAFHLMFQQLETPLPRYASIGFFVAVFSCIGGNNFGVEGIYSELMEVRDLAALDTLHAKLGGAAAFYLFLPGLLLLHYWQLQPFLYWDIFPGINQNLFHQKRISLIGLLSQKPLMLH